MSQLPTTPSGSAGASTTNAVPGPPRVLFVNTMEEVPAHFNHGIVVLTPTSLHARQTMMPAVGEANATPTATTTPLMTNNRRRGDSCARCRRLHIACSGYSASGEPCTRCAKASVDCVQAMRAPVNGVVTEFNAPAESLSNTAVHDKVHDTAAHDTAAYDVLDEWLNLSPEPAVDPSTTTPICSDSVVSSEVSEEVEDDID